MDKLLIYLPDAYNRPRVMGHKGATIAPMVDDCSGWVGLAWNDVPLSPATPMGPGWHIWEGTYNAGRGIDADWDASGRWRKAFSEDLKTFGVLPAEGG